jgi:ribonuclease J
MLEPDFGGRLLSGTTCLHSSWSGYLKKTDWETTRNKIEAESGKLIEVHTSGHMLSTDIIRFVKSLAPKTIVPVHTFEPEQFQLYLENVSIREDGMSWTVA